MIRFNIESCSTKNTVKKKTHMELGVVRTTPKSRRNQTRGLCVDNVTHHVGGGGSMGGFWKLLRILSVKLTDDDGFVPAPRNPIISLDLPSFVRPKWSIQHAGNRCMLVLAQRLYAYWTRIAQRLAQCGRR